MEHIQHPFPPVFDANSHTLILGSFPSVKSREDGFFYGHPQNRFWRVLSSIYQSDCPTSIDDKKAFLLRHGIALWDVVFSCDIVGSSDASIRNVVPTDLSRIIQAAHIKQVLCNGTLATKLYKQYLQPTLLIPGISLPSTSPANATWSLQQLIEAWKTHLSN